MFAMFLIALLALAALAALGVLADSGLRWWSAFDRLRHERPSRAVAAQPHSGMRPSIVHGGCSGFDRSIGRYLAGRPVVRRAA